MTRLATLNGRILPIWGVWNACRVPGAEAVRIVAWSGDSAAFPGAAATSSRLDDLLIEAVFSAGAHFGSLYVLAAGGHLLQMQATIGLPATIARTWATVRVHDSTPVAVSVREQRLIWFSDRVALARAFPAMALSLPYHFAMAASPVCAGGTVWGGIVMGWPPGGEPQLSQRQLDIIDDICDKMGRLLHRASEGGRPVVPSSPPRILDPVPAQRPSPDKAEAHFAAGQPY
ncbi:hypothetical protein [Nonomuraea glycinis]|uniref:hypothetical protein n=1 Tax=Nonomuraea glycinis TaxID=2047744 RepID=UPI00339F433B